ncbi:dihydroxyacetone kinase [Arthrobacter sp. PvP102]|uniref:dihydroxyacetone kinase family protein n=1 Tax=unclassified Arthrobacter TaxID=235627 RepID=UPI001AE9EED3|nr:MULTISPECIES: dihydroxyacetone kinase family protein [unclassified Arthrobacter]MBP1233923.1 dihydroxyacetone kinase [Arthrobacter sp. PvP103]MBP1239057.1 dihydroxyacetone kinase [Arthrobacter sp. PvP102]
MTRLFNEPADFADEMIEGFVASHGRWVKRVSGGVVRNTRSAPDTAALVIGGGSGHYPAFAGLVGQGLAHGAAMGNLFASPSAQQIYHVSKAANNGGGVLLGYGNYAGDVLHFNQAQDRLRAEGIDCRSIAVTDDVSSAPPAERAKRRGIAGDLTVFKVAAAAAESGYSMDDLVAIAERANDRTRSFGVAFTGCTLPGADHQLFSVPEGRMAVGMGIHGEPGIGEADIPTADELAELLVAKLLTEIPDGFEASAGARVVPILNGLGSVKYEELFVVYRHVARLLAEAGLEAVDPQVGELVTSFDMAGTSLTLFWLDDELETLWNAPADAPAFRRGAVTAEALDASAGGTDNSEFADVELSIPEATPDSRAGAVRVLAALGAAKAVVDANADELGRIDAIAGDGDHGIGMERGVRAAVDAARDAVARGAGSATTLHYAADAWADKAGGTSGALWGMALRAVGDAVGNTETPGAGAVAAGVAGAASAIMDFGKAKPGDKTLVDVLVPFRDALAAGVNAGQSLTEAWGAAATVAQQAAEDTARLLPLMGRARPHAEKSLGTPDAGAVSMALIVRAIHNTLAESKAAANTATQNKTVKENA